MVLVDVDHGAESLELGSLGENQHLHEPCFLLGAERRLADWDEGWKLVDWRLANLETGWWLAGWKICWCLVGWETSWWLGGCKLAWCRLVGWETGWKSWVFIKSSFHFKINSLAMAFWTSSELLICTPY